MAFKFNPFTGSLDIVEKLTLAEIDRLTSITGTAGDELVLTSDGSDMTLTADRTDLIFANELTADKYDAANTTRGTSFDNIYSQVNISGSSIDASVYRNFHADFDYTHAGAGFDSTSGNKQLFYGKGDLDVTSASASGNFVGLDVDLDHTYSSGVFDGVNVYGANLSIALSGAGTYFGIAQGLRVSVGADGIASPNPPSNAAGLSVALSASDSNAIFGAYTQASNAGTAHAYGYEGYGLNSSANTSWNATGLWGFAKSDNGIEVGVYGTTFSASSKAFAGVWNGHMHQWQGVYYHNKTASPATIGSKTHIAETDDGSVWIEAHLEVDEDLWADGTFNTPELTPAQITSDQNDYDPGNTSFLHLTTDATRTITGFSGGQDGRHLWLVNAGANNLQLSDQDTNSAAANRMIGSTAATIVLQPDESAHLIYDASDSRWRIIDTTGT